MRASAAQNILISTTGIAIGALLLSSCSNSDDATARSQASPTSASATCAAPEAGSNAQDTASYRMVVSASEPEMMVTPEQVDAEDLTEGELIMGGDMDMGSEPEANGHVEVAICDLATETTLTGAEVTMEIVTNGQARPMMVMEMRGLDEPATESHYGNNTVLPGTAYRMRVSVNGESAEFPMAAAAG